MTDYPQVLSASQVKTLFGEFSWTPNGSSAVTISPKWTEANIQTILIPELVGVPTYGGKFNGRVRFHRKGAEQLQRAWQEVGKSGHLSDVIFWDGSFVPRRMRGSQSLSRHSWGTAFDINAEWNPFRQPMAKAGQKGYLGRIAPIFEAHGFAWGGRWESPDGMHFEVAELRDYEEVEARPDALLVVNDQTAKALPLTMRDGMNYADLSDLAALVGDGAKGDAAVKTDLVAVGPYLSALGFRVAWNPEQRKVYAYR